jgi:hypothetical protein
MTGRHAQTAGIGEGLSLGTTDQPDLVEVKANIKEIVTVWEVSTKAELLSESDDGLGNLAAWLRKENAEAHAFYIDQQLLADSETATGNNLDSIDKVTMSHAAGAAINDVNTDVDMWDINDDGIDRSETTAWSAPYTGHNSGTPDTLTLAMVDAAIQSALEAGVNYNSLILLTGYDTYQDLKTLMSTNGNAAWNYNLAQGGAGNMNGVAGESGLAFDSRVGSYDGIPIFLSQHVASAVAGDATARIHLLDMDNLAFRVAAPTTYLDNTNIAVTQTLSKDFAFLTAGNLICYKFTTQGSIRDLDQ